MRGREGGGEREEGMEGGREERGGGLVGGSTRQEGEKSSIFRLNTNPPLH